MSCYGLLYNLLRFNHGYHQEHHYRPQVHWTRVPAMKTLLPPESDRRVVRWAHWFNIGPVTPSRRQVPASPPSGRIPAHRNVVESNLGGILDVS